MTIDILPTDKSGGFTRALGKVEIVQLSDNTFLERAMERKEQQAIQIGARLVFKDGSREAVGVEQIKASGESNAADTQIPDNLG